MDSATVILVGLQASVFLTVFSLGLEATVRDALSLLRRPGLLLRSIAAMFIVMPLVAMMLARQFQFAHAVQIALLVLAVSPVPPILPMKAEKLAGRNPYMFGLLVEMALLSVVATPLAVVTLGRAFGLQTHVSPFDIAAVVSRTVLLPLGLGLWVRAMSPRFAARVGGPLSLATKIALGLGGLLLLIGGRHLIAGLLSDGTLAAMAVFTAVGVAVGHLLGGPVDEDRTILAIATSARHPGVALVAAHAVAPEEQKLVVAAVLLYLVMNALVTAPYARWRKHGIPMARAAGIGR